VKLEKTLNPYIHPLTLTFIPSLASLSLFSPPSSPYFFILPSPSHSFMVCLAGTACFITSATGKGDRSLKPQYHYSTTPFQYKLSLECPKLVTKVLKRAVERPVSSTLLPPSLPPSSLPSSPSPEGGKREVK
jgi:hypothetical protein